MVPGGVAGGSKYIVQDILFKFALDIDGLYGNNDTAASKVGGMKQHEEYTENLLSMAVWLYVSQPLAHCCSGVCCL
jgi:hypothetical protein